MIEATIKMKAITVKRSELMQTLRSMAEEIRGIKGCKSCVFYQDVDDGNSFNLIQVWSSKEKLDSYLKSDTFGALIGTKSLLVEPPEINLNTILNTISSTTGMEAVIKARGKDRDLNMKEGKEN